jgi:hypothetical protein
VRIIIAIAVLLVSCGTDHTVKQQTMYDDIRRWQDAEIELAETVDGYVPSLQELKEYTSKYDFSYESENGTDYGKTSHEFETDGYRGDCEDMVQFVLVDLKIKFGIADDDMWAVVVSLGHDRMHTILSVMTDQGLKYYDPMFRPHGRFYWKEHRMVAEYNLFDIRIY